MNEIDPAERPPAPPPAAAAGDSARMVLARIGIALVVMAAITATGLEIYHNQRDRAGMPVAMAPAPRETVAPTVEDVVTRFEKAVEANPADAEAWRNLGWSYFQRGQFSQSADALRHAADIDPTNARTLSFLGEAVLQAHKGQRRMPWEARAAFDEALKNDPKDARARYYRAFGWDLAGQHRRAISGWLALLADTPPDAPYAGDIRAVITAVGARHHIRVEKRLAEVQYVPPGSPAAAATAAAAAKARAGAATLPGPAGDLMRAVEDVPRVAPTGK
jgi:cytochrome c-type biogenesis protein CcmH